MGVFAFQLAVVFAQKMLFTDGERGEVIEKSVNQVWFCNKPAHPTQSEAFPGRLGG